MKKSLALIALLAVSGMALTACNTDDLRVWCETQRKQAPKGVTPLPTVTQFVAMKFEPKTDRMPFVLPKPEIS